jgi:hypothetical protein
MAGSQPVSLPRTENLLTAEENGEPSRDGRWVVFEYCISVVAVTLRRTSRPYYLEYAEWAWLRGLPYVGVSLLLGWWGVPWGVIYTPVTIFANLSGGCDITAQVREAACADA